MSGYEAEDHRFGPEDTGGRGTRVYDCASVEPPRADGVRQRPRKVTTDVRVRAGVSDSSQYPIHKPS